MANCSCVCMQLGCIGCLTWHYYDSPQSALLLRRVAFIRAVLIDSTIHPLGRFFASSVLYEFYRWSISFARDLHRLPIVANMSHCINTTSNCSFVPHAVHFHMELLNFYSVLCFSLSILLGTYCYYCLQSHPNSLSTHDVHNATLKQWHFDMSRVS